MLMTGMPWNAAASALEMTASTAISLGNLTATSLPVVNNDDKPDDLPSDISNDARRAEQHSLGGVLAAVLRFYAHKSIGARHWETAAQAVCVHKRVLLLLSSLFTFFQ